MSRLIEGDYDEICEDLERAYARSPKFPFQHGIFEIKPAYFNEFTMEGDATYFTFNPAVFNGLADTFDIDRDAEPWHDYRSLSEFVQAEGA